MGAGVESGFGGVAGRHFVTRRERRLWLWTALVVVAIYSTLGLARVGADELRRRDLADAAFGWGFTLIVVAIVALGIRARPRGLEVGIGVGVFAVYLLVLARMVIPEERTHVVEYGVVVVLIHEALVERRTVDRRVRAPAVVALVLAMAIGVIDELIQLVLPSRVFDVRDILTNSISALLALVAKLSLGWARVADVSPRLLPGSRNRRAGRSRPG